MDKDSLFLQYGTDVRYILRSKPHHDVARKSYAYVGVPTLQKARSLVKL
jgi:hypothetical protein